MIIFQEILPKKVIGASGDIIGWRRPAGGFGWKQKTLLTTGGSVAVFFDTTQTKSESLVAEAQKMINELEGGLTITTYGNLMNGITVYLPDKDLSGSLY